MGNWVRAGVLVFGAAGSGVAKAGRSAGEDEEGGGGGGRGRRRRRRRGKEGGGGEGVSE